MAEELDAKLFLAVRKGQTAVILKYLEQGANINCRDKIKGSTPLIEACIRRNYVIQKLLLSHGAKPNLANSAGLTPLHFVAEEGDEESVKLLLAYQAPIDRADQDGCTPLHYAVNRNRPSTADLLVFCGADASRKNTSGKTAAVGCTDPNIRKILKHSELIQTGIRNNDIFIQHTELERYKTVYLDKLGLKIHVPESFKTNSLSFLCRRVRPEYCDPSLRPLGRELLMSDTFEFRITAAQFKGLVTVEIPLYDYLDPFEDVYLKTDEKPEIRYDDVMCQPVQNIKRDENFTTEIKWICVLDIDITKIKAFNLVTLPKIEHMNVDDNGGVKFTSTVDKFIQVSAPPGSFDDSGDLSLEVMPCPPYREDVYQEILSVSHFYDINYNSTLGYQPNKDVQLTIPIPHNYEGDNDFYILSANRTSEYYADSDSEDCDDPSDIWEVVEKEPGSRAGRVDCKLSHFSICVLTEAKRGKSIEEVKMDTDKLCRKAAKRQIYIIFFAMLKCLGGEFYDVIIECTTQRRLDERKKYWFEQKYTDENLVCTGEFETKPAQGYRIRFSGNVQTLVDIGDIRLQHHPKRKNHQQIQIKLKETDGQKFGIITIFEDQAEGDPVHLTSISLILPGLYIGDVTETEEDTGFKGFTRDKFLRLLAEKIGNEWVKISVLLGLTYRTVEEYKNSKRNKNNKENKNQKDKNNKKKVESSTDRIMKVLQQWRELSMHRLDNYGVPDLISALHRVGRDDLVKFVITELQNWINYAKEEKDPFYRWAVAAVDGLKSVRHENSLMSDKSLQDLVAANLGKEWEQVLENLGLTVSEMDQIKQENPHNTVTQVTKALVKWRDELDKPDKKLIEDLYEALQEAGRSDLVSELKDEFNREGTYQDPEPMSDMFLLLLVETCPEDLISIWSLLELTEGEMEIISDDPLASNHQHQLLNMLITARENSGDTPDAFMKLVDALKVRKVRNLDKAHDWMIESCKKWLKKCEETEGPLKQTIEDYIAEI